MRHITFYWLIALNVLLLLANVALAFYVSSLRDDVQQTVVSQNVGCKRANVQRDAVRFLLLGRVHDSNLVSAASQDPVIADYFKFQGRDAQKKLNGLVAAAALTFPDPVDPYLVDCDRSYPLP